MKTNYAAAITQILKSEGGYVNHPKDPGKATNRGITIGTLRQYRRPHRVTVQDVKDLGLKETKEIYRRRYWDKVKGDLLPSGIDLCVFDFAVNSGTGRSAKFLQRALGVAQDGKIGPDTIASARKADPRKVINQMCDERMTFLRRLSTFKVFGRGWTRRVTDIRGMSLRLVSAPKPGEPTEIPNPTPDPAQRSLWAVLWALVRRLLGVV